MKTSKRFLLLLCVGAMALGTLTCDSGGGIIASEEPISVEGAAVLRNDQEIVLIENGLVTGEIDLHIGNNSDVYRVEFHDENGDALSLFNPGYTLRICRDQNGLCKFNQAADAAVGQFCVQGQCEGSSCFKFELLFKNTLEYSSPAIPVSVRQATMVDGLLDE